MFVKLVDLILLASAEEGNGAEERIIERAENSGSEENASRGGNTGLG